MTENSWASILELIGRNEKKFVYEPVVSRDEALELAKALIAVQQDRGVARNVKVKLIDNLDHKVKFKGESALQPLIDFMSQGGFRVIEENQRWAGE